MAPSLVAERAGGDGWRFEEDVMVALKLYVENNKRWSRYIESVVKSSIPQSPGVDVASGSQGVVSKVKSSYFVTG